MHAFNGMFELVGFNFGYTYRISPAGGGDHATSIVKRQNLTMRRFTRPTNAFSKKIEILRAAVSLHFEHHNFVRVHRSLHHASNGSWGEKSAMVPR